MSIPTDGSPLARLVRKVDDASSGASAGDTFATGFPSIDAVLGGGLRRGDLVVLGGDVGCGKSSLALAIALRMAESGTAVTYLTSEMTRERLLERALAIEARCRVDDLRSGALNGLARAAVGAVAVRLREKTPRFGTLSGGGPDSVGEALRRPPAPEVAFIDPLQALACGVRPQIEELASAVRTLKRLAIELDLAMVVTTQLHRGHGSATDSRPDLDDFNALGAVKQEADQILGIFREEMYRPGGGVEGATELLILKNRNGNVGYVDLYFYKHWLRFEDMLEPDR